MFLRILLTHNTYLHRGGEDAVVEEEARLLEDHGHQVRLLIRHNDEIRNINPIRAAAGTLWSRQSARRIGACISSFRPDIIHSHNTFPLISPALYWTASRRGVPVVQTLHNFRLLCPQAMFLRDGRVCEDCLGKIPWRGALHACFRESKPLSLLVMAMLCLHRSIGTYRRKVTQYIALNEFCRRKFIEGGLPASRISIKPNFVDQPQRVSNRRKGFLFVGRLSPEKGVHTLAKASQIVSEDRITFIGEGPCQKDLINYPRLDIKGFLKPEAVQLAMTQAVSLIMTSICYENFPRTIVEAYANGLPVIASRCGALQDLVTDGQTGLLFEPGNSEDLSQKMLWAMRHPEEMKLMGAAARAEYETKYTPSVNYRQMMSIYAQSLESMKNNGD